MRINSEIEVDFGEFKRQIVSGDCFGSGIRLKILSRKKLPL